MLNIKRVVLYKHGVGHFEREGLVTGDAVVPLQFKQREVSDVLKSLTVLDLDGGLISTVSYDSTTPVEQLLSEIAISIPDEDSLTSLLPQLKGARVSIRPTAATPPAPDSGAGKTVIGTLLGIDTVADGDIGRARKFRVSILTDASEMRSFDLFDIELQLLDESLKRDLDFYLKTQLAAKKKDARTFTLVASGEGERRLRVSYVLEAPVWKATYRLLLAAEGEDPMIQGWAVVDNTSDEDWDGVALTLVAGLPVSFTHDLYTPRHVRRPVIEVRESAGVLPPMVEAGFGEIHDGAATMDFMDQPMAVAAAAPMSRMMVGAAQKRSMARGGGPSSVETQTRTRTVGDLFEYSIDTPVTVRRNQSALVPIVLKPFKGQTVLLYQKHARPENPIRCVEFENTTGLTLEGGPVTVLEQGTYVGEAMLDTMKPRETRLVGYAVELAVRVSDTREQSSHRVTRIVVQGGTLVATASVVMQTTYLFASKAEKSQRAYVDHPRPGGDWKLVEPTATHEITENFWRLKLDIAANQTTRLVVRAEQNQSTTYGLFDAHDNQLQAWVSDRWIDKPTAAALEAAFVIRRRIAELEQMVQRLNGERQQLHCEQARIRDNLKALNERPSEKDLRERYIRTLTSQEDRLEAIERDAAKAIADQTAARQELNAKLMAIAYTGAVS
jgi:hypothetical protein